MNPDTAQFKQQIRSALAQRPRAVLEDPALICAAVLVPLLYKENEWHVLVTQRTQTVGHHKGQISFPGGACEPGDVDLLATALREAHEEIGVPPEAVEILGALDDMRTITDFSVTPFVGVIPYPFAYRLHAGEVEAVIEVPLSFLRDPAHLRVEQMPYEGRMHDVLFWDYGPYTIWGATARMLQSLLDLVLGTD
jgi:8-oxo-dGTP pyrophosphatase MutT (NUDIX family)